MNPSGHGFPSFHLVLNCTCGYGRIDKIPFFEILDRKSLTPVGHNGLQVTRGPISSYQVKPNPSLIRESVTT